MKLLSNGVRNRRRRQTIFIVLMLAWPVLQFIMTWGINANMVVMAFYDYTLGAKSGQFVGFENFFGVFRLFDTSRVYTEWYAVRNSLSLVVLTLFINAPISLAFSYLLYLKMRGYRMFQVLLYIPCITSAVVLVLVFKSFMMSGPIDSLYSLLGIYGKLPNEGWLGEHTAWNTILIFSIWTGFSTNILYFLSSMRRIPADFIEAAELDGATEFRTFTSIVMPLISPTVCTMLSLSLATLFGWCMPSLLMMGTDSGINFTGTLGLSILHWTSSKAYGTAAAYGILLTAIGAPLMIGIRILSKKLEQNVEY